MSDDSRTRFSLRRWSERKREASRKDATIRDDEPTAAAPPPVSHPAAQAGNAVTPTAAAVDATGAPMRTDIDRTPSAEAPLPPVESLTFDSDFTAFMRPGVDADVKRAALRKLVRDPRFNVMDGLDVYIDDYSKPDPIDPAIVRTLMQARYIFAPPKTRLNAEGHAEDVPEEPAAPDVASAAAAPQTAASGAIADPSTVASSSTSTTQAASAEDTPATAPPPERP